MPSREDDSRRFFAVHLRRLFEELKKYEEKFKWAMSVVPGGSGFIHECLGLFQDLGDRLAWLEHGAHQRMDAIQKELDALKATIEKMEKEKNG